MRPVLLTALAVSGAATLAAQQRAISDSDLFAFRWVASPQISPDGRQAAYVLVTVNAKHDGYETSLWLVRSEEHTSELQSQSNLVCRLLLEKKKTKNRSRQRSSVGG